MRHPHAVCKIPAAPGPIRLASVALAMGRAERRLAAILVADAAGYSRLIGADEEGNARTARACSPRGSRSETQGVPRPHRQKHRRRVAVEFASVVHALLCATEVQGSAWLSERRAADGQRGRASCTQVRMKPSSSVRAKSIAWSIDLPCCVHWATILQMVPCANICAPRLVGAG